MSLYTILVRYQRGDEIVEEPLDDDGEWRMPLLAADLFAAHCNKRHAPDRQYRSVNVNELSRGGANDERASRT